jgi:RHS repeat-associated protein
MRSAIIFVCLLCLSFATHGQTIGGGPTTNVCPGETYTYSISLGNYCTTTVNTMNCTGCEKISATSSSITLKWLPGHSSYAVTGAAICREPDDPSGSFVETPVSAYITPTNLQSEQIICLSEVDTQLTYYNLSNPVPDSPGRCKTSVHASLENDPEFPLFSEKGYPFDKDYFDGKGMQAELFGDGGYGFKLKMRWLPEWKGTITVSVYYKIRDKKNFLDDCDVVRTTEIMRYTFIRGPSDPGGTLSGPATVEITEDQTSVTLTYNKNTEYPGHVQAFRYFDNGTLVGEKAACVTNTFTHAIGIGTHAFTTKLLDQCGEWYDGPNHTVTVYPSCYNDNPDAALFLTGPGFPPHPEDGYKLIQNQPYTLSAPDISDFDKNYEWTHDGGGDISLEGNTLTLLKGLGSYRVTALKKPGREECPSPDPIHIFIGGEDVTLTKDCPLILPTDFEELGYDFEDNDIVFQHFAATVVSKRSITILPGIQLKLGAELILVSGPPAPQPADTDSAMNYVQTTSYDEYGRISASSRSYFDSQGRALQNQYKNLSDSVVMATQTIYDAYGRSVIQTLPAPVSVMNVTTDTCTHKQIGDDLRFQYKPDFVLAGQHEVYNYRHFDLDKEQTPDTVYSKKPGTLGWYYSTNNGTATGESQLMNERFVAATRYPYSRTLFHKDGSGDMKSVSKPGDVFKVGGGHLSESSRYPVATNDPYLAAYLNIRTTHLKLKRPASVDGKFFYVSAIDENGNKSVVYADQAGKTLITLYFAKQLTPIKKSYQFYDEAGRLVESISPKGVKQFESNVTFDLIDKTQYTYHPKGWLTSMKEIDADTMHYFYRKDGSIRFSQNAEQETAHKFSYTHYDASGRPIESGEYTSTEIEFGSAALMAAIENIADEGLVGKGIFSNQFFTFYDETAETLREHDDESIKTIAREIVESGRVQRFTAGAVSLSKSDSVATWYSYSENGGVEWMVQRINGLGTKTIDYRYGPTGAIQEIIYQKGSAAVDQERFTHYYEYDRDGRLYRIYTTTSQLVYDVNGKLTNEGIVYNDEGLIVESGPMHLQATYLYYLHGPLKRIIYEDDLQGIDFTYTADGLLKSINDAIKANDPGKDDDDVFGLTLDYYSADYLTRDYHPGDVTYPDSSPNQFSGVVKGMRWHSPIDVNAPFAFAYQYDEQYQFTKARWGTVIANTMVPDGTKYEESIGTEDKERYDLNGNIRHLLRKDKDGVAIADFTYDYFSNTNKLQRVDHYDAVAGKTKTVREYDYDLIGRMKYEKRGDDEMYMTYDVSGKLTGVYRDNDHKKAVVTFGYDDRGFRLFKKRYNEDGVTVNGTTWYVRDGSGNVAAIYNENNANREAAVVTELPVYGAARIGIYKPAYGQTLYEVSDHLGNVRAVIAGATQVTTLATMEDGRSDKEAQDFFGIKSTITSRSINHTPSTVTVEGITDRLEANKVIRLNNRPNGRYKPNPIGGGTMVWVHPGDTVKAEVYVKYARMEREKNKRQLLALASLAKGLTPLANATELKKAFQIFSDRSFRALPAWGKLNDAQPPAFLNGLVFDKDMKLQHFDFDQVSEAAHINLKNPDAPHEKLELQFVAQKEGYIYIYVSNESKEDLDVYFDDLLVTYTFGQVVAGGDYYPFGAEIADRQITLEEYRYGYQGKYAEDDKETSWSHFELRQYDPIVGRWTTVDPKRIGFSPYIGMYNNPVSGIDPDGAGPPTDLFDKTTGEFITHIDDGIDQVAFVSQEQASYLSSLWSGGDQASYFSFLNRVGWIVNLDSDLGKIIRVTYSEMSGVGTTSDVDRQIVAESIVNRYNTGLYGETYSEILTRSQYNAVGTEAYNDPYGYIDGLKTNSPYYFRAKQDQILHNFYNSVSVSYQAYHGIGTRIGNGVVSYVSPPLLSTHFDGDPYLKNITSSISGLKGISGAWGRK